MEEQPQTKTLSLQLRSPLYTDLQYFHCSLSFPVINKTVNNISFRDCVMFCFVMSSVEETFIFSLRFNKNKLHLTTAVSVGASDELVVWGL